MTTFPDNFKYAELTSANIVYQEFNSLCKNHYQPSTVLIVISEFHEKLSTVSSCLPYLMPFVMFLPEKGITVNPTDTKGRQLKGMFRWRKTNNTKQMDFVDGYFESLWQRILLFDCSYDLRTHSRRQITTGLRNMYQRITPKSTVNKSGKGHRNTYVRLCRRIYYFDDRIH